MTTLAAMYKISVALELVKKYEEMLRGFSPFPRQSIRGSFRKVVSSLRSKKAGINKIGVNSKSHQIVCFSWDHAATTRRIRKNEYNIPHRIEFGILWVAYFTIIVLECF